MQGSIFAENVILSKWVNLRSPRNSSVYFASQPFISWIQIFFISSESEVGCLREHHPRVGVRLRVGGQD